ncbi:hypothetical protein B0H13DRAFT_2672537 [Mycena leptocephala]|nr:hypothetical protein B0H13DRAFT_2672537 [Mycena leptocephala]
MPILLDSLQVLSVSFSLVPHSSLSSRFRTLLHSNARILSLLVTTLADVILGLDWAAFLCDSLLGLEYRVNSTFSAWRFVSDPDHPMSNRPPAPSSGPVPTGLAATSDVRTGLIAGSPTCRRSFQPCSRARFREREPT